MTEGKKLVPTPNMRFQNPFLFQQFNRTQSADSEEDFDDNLLEDINANDIGYATHSSDSILFQHSSDSIVFQHSESYNNNESPSTPSVYESSIAGTTTDNQVVLSGPKPANNLMLLSLLEHLCTSYVDDEETGNRLFKVLCEKLYGMRLIQNFGALDNVKAIRQKYRTAFVDMMNGALETLNPSIQPKIWRVSDKRNYPTLSLHSWYKDMFHEENLIAVGGFGEVCKAKNKLDLKCYAIKKVKLIESQPELCQKTLREVQVFSNLNHDHVVRYHSSWLEYGFLEFTSSEKKNKGFKEPKRVNRIPPTDRSDLVSLNLLGSRFGNVNIGLLQNNNAKKLQRCITYEENEVENSSTNTNMFNVGDSLSNSNFSNLSYFDTSHSVDIDKNLSNIASNSHNGLSDSFKDVEPVRKRLPSLGRSFSSGDIPLQKHQIEEIKYCRDKFYDTNLKKALNMTLFIQMELCQLTLQKWITDRNNEIQKSSLTVDRLMNLNIFRQTLLAIQYIHGEGLIHRDMKPANIFLNTTESNKDLCVKIGDFGLARDDILPKTPTDEFSHSDAPLSCYSLQPNSQHTIGVGTTTYAAPEQKTSRYYSHKVDLFSLGIILFELFKPFNTGMERQQLIHSLVENCTCGDIEQIWIDECKLMLQLVSKDPEQRPCSDTILSLPFLLEKSRSDDNDMDKLKARLTEQEKEIQRLKILLQEAQSKICFKCQSQC